MYARKGVCLFSISGLGKDVYLFLDLTGQLPEAWPSSCLSFPRFLIEEEERKHERLSKSGLNFNKTLNSRTIGKKILFSRSRKALYFYKMLLFQERDREVVSFVRFP